MHARWLSFVVWALLAASVAYWSLTLMAKGPLAPAQSRAAMSSGAPADWTRLFSATPTAAPVEAASSRYQLLGVVAPSTAGHPGEGVALIVVTGGVPRPVRIGQLVEGDLTLIEINRRDVGLGSNGTVTVRLSLAPGAGGDTMPGQPPQAVPGAAVAPMPPNFNGQPGPTHGVAPNGEAMVLPTAINPQLPVGLPVQQPGDGSANPLK